MKKIFILLLLLTSSLTLSATLYAWDLNDQPIAELNNHTLREVFEGGELLTNGDFSNGTTGWIPNLVTISVSNNELINTITSLDTSNGVYTFEPNVIIGNTYYIKADVYVKYNNLFNIRFGGVNNFILPEVTNSWVTLSKTITAETTEITQIYHWTNTNYVVGDTFKYRKLLLINQTALGISSLTKEQMDNYYLQYVSRNNANYDLDDSKSTNVLTIMQDFQDILLGTEDKKGFVDYVDDFLFKERTVGFSIKGLGIYYEWKFKPFYLLGTTLFVTLMGLVLVKKFVPVA